MAFPVCCWAMRRSYKPYTHQNIAELWNAMTRPINRNGFGLAIADAEREVQELEAGMSLLADSEAVYREVAKKSSCDTTCRESKCTMPLAAAMYVHGVESILTLNVGDFNRFAGLGAVHPSNI